MKQPMSGGNRREKDAQKLSEGHADGSDSAGLNDQEQCPAVKKSPERAEGFAKINVLPARMRHHGGKFTVSKGSDDGEESGDQPRANEERWRTDFAGNFCGYEKNSRTNHRTHHQHGRAGQAKPFDEFTV